MRHNRGAVLIAYNEPTVAVLAPERAVVRFDWPTPLPRYAPWPGARDRFRRARYLFPSRALRDEWLANNRVVDRSRTVVIHNAVDLELFAPSPLPPGPPWRVGFAGQWVPEKGLQVLLDAWPTIEREVAEVELVLAGGPTLWKRTTPAPGAAELAARVQSMASRYRIRWVGTLDRTAMPGFWRSVHIACVPSVWSEPFGLVALEAMACGRPVVATDRGALPEVVADAGAIVPAGQPEALAAAVVRLLKTPASLEPMGQRAATRSREFEPSARAAQLLSLVAGT